MWVDEHPPFFRVPEEYFRLSRDSLDYYTLTPKDCHPLRGILLHYGLALTVARIISLGKKMCDPGTPQEEIGQGYGFKVLFQPVPHFTGVDLKTVYPWSHTYDWILAVVSTDDLLETRLKQ